MKKIVLLISFLLAGSTWLMAKGQSNDHMHKKLFEAPEQGQVMTNLQGEVTLVDGPEGKKIPVFKTEEGAYLLLSRGKSMFEEGTKLTLDGYTQAPKEGAELEGFDFEGKKILPALHITMASDEEGNIIRKSQPRRGKSHPPKGRR